ncbi:MAG: phospholipase D family protein [bacterium]|nr:phospholipase D family protein [bacterium]
MLQPTNRLTLIDALRPPAGFALESAAAVTYTLDLQALLAAPAAMALTGPDGIVPDDGRLEPIKLLHALRTHAGKLTVLCQAGAIALPPSRRVFAFLEGSVIPTLAPRGGIVHPKVWVLRYEAGEPPPHGAGRQRRLRVLVASRNLTFDASWDALVRLDETSAANGASLEPVGQLFDDLLGHSVGDVGEVHRNRVRSLADALGSARFALPGGVRELRTHILGLTQRSSPLPAAAERSLIISPFVSDDFFTTVHPRPVDELVSTPEWLDRLDPASLERVKTVHIFDDGSARDTATDEASSSPDDPGRPIAGLHAKIFAFENDGRAHLFLGSANATGPAFGSNAEILLELVGSAETLGIDRLCSGTEDEPGLRDLFRIYHRPEGLRDPNGDGNGDGNGRGALDGARRAISRLQFEGYVEQSGTGWAVTYRTCEPLQAPDGTVIHCWPLATAGHRRRVASGEPMEARFETTLEAISGFLAFELTRSDDEDPRTCFVVPVPLDGVPDERQSALLRALVGNAERFFRYLLALLDEDSDHMSLLDAVEGVGKGTAGGGGGMSSLPVLEKLLRTMRRDPAKLAGLHPLVSDLAEDGALPPGFAELWATIHDVAHLEAPDR